LDTSPLLEVDRVTAGYGRFDVLQEVSLVVFRGELVSIIGPNGAGKSTVLRALYGKAIVRSGRIRFQGEDITGLRTHAICRQGIALAPQGHSVFPYMSVRENLELGAFIRRDRAAVRREAIELCRRFPVLHEKQDLPAGALSGGEQQILELARCLMLRPRMIVMDEPSLGLSPRAVATVFETLVEMRAAGVTILIVEQNAKQALRVSDRAYVLELGRNRYEGTGASLLDNVDVRKLYLGGR
jgi:ABC-type branched-subunit amino acid transport system ATPase component